MVKSSRTPHVLLLSECGMETFCFPKQQYRGIVKQGMSPHSPLYGQKHHRLQISNEEIEVIESWIDFNNFTPLSPKVDKDYDEDLAATLPCESSCSSLESSASLKSTPSCLSSTSSKANRRTAHGSTSRTSKQKQPRRKVCFSTVEVREHPRILGDNPSVKRGPALSIDWFTPDRCKVWRTTVDDFEERHQPTTRSKKITVLSSSRRKKILAQQAGVSIDDMARAKHEAALIQQSRRSHNMLVEYDNTRVALETCWQTTAEWMMMGMSSTTTTRELEQLMDQARQSSLQRRMATAAAVQ